MCNQGVEFVRRLHMSWAEVIHLVMYNLREIGSRKNHNSSGPRGDTIFDLDKDILVYLEKNWDTFQLPPEVAPENLYIRIFPLLTSTLLNSVFLQIFNVPPDERRNKVLNTIKNKEVR